MDNKIEEVRSRDIAPQYEVNIPGHAGPVYSTAREAAESFGKAAPEERAFVLKTVRDKGGQSVSTLVAKTEADGNPADRTLQKVVVKGADPEFAREYRKLTTPALDKTVEKGGDTRRLSKKADLATRSLDEHFERRGRAYHLKQAPDGGPAFELKGQIGKRALVTKHNDNELVVKGMVDVAQEQGWSTLKASGATEFRRHVWIEASSRGMLVQGYEPTPADRDEIEQRRKQLERQVEVVANKITSANPQRSVDASSATGATRSPSEMRGTVVDHGSAPYKHIEGESQSYYIALRQDDGQVKVLWGVDLERASRESRLQIGDRVERVGRVGSKNVEVTANVRDESGKIIAREPIESHRNRWEIEIQPRNPEVTPGRSELALRADEKALMDAIVAASPPEARRQVAEAAARQFKALHERGLRPEVKVYDPNAPSKLPPAQPNPLRQREPPRELRR